MISFLKKIFLNQKSKNETDLDSICPYCKKILEQKPTRKKKCPFCNNFIFVRTLPTTRKKVLVTEDEVKTIELEWDKINYRKSRLQHLGCYGITEKDFENYKEKFKYEVSDRDAIWSLYNKLLQKNMEENNFGTLTCIYNDMALMLNKEGKECFTFLQQAKKMELLRYQQYQSTMILGVKISTCGINSCEACQKLNDKVFTIKEALDKMPIPCKECTNKIFNDKYPFCRCGYNTVSAKVIRQNI